MLKHELKYWFNEAVKKFNLDDIKEVTLNMIPRKEYRIQTLLINSFFNIAD